MTIFAGISRRRAAAVARRAFATALIVAASGAGAAEPRIVNGLPTQGYPAVGALLYSGKANSTITDDNAQTWCTGTLVGCRTFLTAAHCVADDVAASHYRVYLQNGGVAAVSSITVYPGYAEGIWSRDVAVVRLASAVAGIDPASVNSSHDLDALGVGKKGTIVSFGRSGSGSDYGIKRYGAVVTADCNLSLTEGYGNDTEVCWNYDYSVGPAGTDSNSCNGDSGGPLFMAFANGTEVVGVTSAGVSPTCAPGDHSWDASVYYHSAWILGRIGTDSTSACGEVAAVGEQGTTTHEEDGTLDASHPQVSFAVGVPAGARRLVFALNGTDDGFFDPDVFVKFGSAATTTSYNCKADGVSAYGACAFDSPAGGTWQVLVRRASGSGKYQLTTTVFGAGPTCGDSSLDGVLNATDALDALRASVGLLSCDPCVCDANGSGSVSASDAERILRVAVGEDAGLDCPQCG